MKKLLLVALFGAYSLLAADLTGHWSGSVQSKSPDGEDHNEDVLLILKQDGSTITGTAGPNEEEQTAIVKAVLEGDTLRFDVITDEGMAFHVTLKLDGKPGRRSSN